MSADTLTRVAWRVVPIMPRPLTAVLFRTAADWAWLRGGKGVGQLERNLKRVRPQANHRDIRRLSRQAMRSYMRYYREVFELKKLSHQQISARIRFTSMEHLNDILIQGKSASLVLGHMGNWDLVGAYYGSMIGPITTVAEHLEPESIFREFLGLRERLGMSVIPLDSGSILRKLIAAAKSDDKRRLICLLADRDLSHSGIEVTMFGETMRVATGPVSLALAAHIPLCPITMHAERLHGERARQAGSRWGYAVDFGAPIPVPQGVSKPEQVELMSQAWVNYLATAIATHPTDWHMLQKVFVADLDPVRDAAIRAGGADTSAAEQGARP